MFYVKKSVTFYEKPGCAGNKKQKEVLSANGVDFEVKSMLSTNWDIKTLNSFFQDLSKEQIVNQFAPKIKSGEINIKKLTKEQLVELMIKEPLLIKRPLIQVNDIKICGFDIPKLNKALNLEIDTKKEIGTCQSSDSCTSV
ncbi:ArsC/Spx/MgsR family protein [Halarcobacter anaerophilus]|uniref:Arsenate reductase family protein n=1 Tax=Halarcobacter anaerophilus TaxID=877500 RepID=A0A4Q0Y336_9BACT|nr:ArsC/Spx/MgsR family protein [Halarcobacter anaerophilus]QDF29290.1 arsenate reductase (ArsC) family protein [Halarcobacter anaerophilus]RXJ64540.1 arsenate reductase family protein [Halarcobacter anaerophilus]